MFSNILHLLLRAVQRYGTLIALGSTSCVSWVSDDPDQSYLRAPLFSRGTGWDFQELEDLQTLKSLSWWYDWGPNGDAAALNFSHHQGIEFVPMQWGRWGIDSLAKDIVPVARHLLGMNEPGHQQQSNMEPAEAAALWPQMEKVASTIGLRLGTPSPAPCGADCVRSNPFQWFDEFFAACKNCHFDFLATHLYTCNADALRWYLNDCKRYHLPIWLTEFSCPNGASGPTSRQITFMTDAIKVLDLDNDVERYAWFAPRTAGDWLGPSASLLRADGADLTQLGELYTAKQSQAGTRETAKDLRSWTSMCSTCFLPNYSSASDRTMRQLCSDCGFDSSIAVH